MLTCPDVLQAEALGPPFDAVKVICEQTTNRHMFIHFVWRNRKIVGEPQGNTHLRPAWWDSQTQSCDSG